MWRCGARPCALACDALVLLCVYLLSSLGARLCAWQGGRSSEMYFIVEGEVVVRVVSVCTLIGTCFFLVTGLNNAGFSL